MKNSRPEGFFERKMKMSFLPILSLPDSIGQSREKLILLDSRLRTAGMTGKRIYSAGFTLLEVMIALAIIGGLLVTLIYTLNYNLGIIDKHEIITVASLLAREKIMETEKPLAGEKGSFPEPYADYIYETSVKESTFPDTSEFSIVVSRGREEVRFSKLVRNPK